MSRIAVKIACWLLKLPLSIEERTMLIGAILDRLEAVPLSNIITVREGDGAMIVNGKVIDHEAAVQLRAGARAALNNVTRKMVHEQVAVVAGTRGVVQGTTPEKLYFYRAALWCLRTEEQIYRTLAGESDE